MAPVSIAQFGVHAQPLEFMDYLLGDAVDRGDGLWYFAQQGVNRLPTDVVLMLAESAGGTLPQVSIDTGGGSFVRDSKAAKLK